MTAQEIKHITKFQAALDRAYADGYHVTAIIKKQGQHVAYLLENRDGSKLHIITRAGLNLTCDCEAADHHTYCMHRAYVTNFLMQRADAAKRDAERVQEAEAQFIRDTALPIQANQAPHIYR